MLNMYFKLFNNMKKLKIFLSVLCIAACFTAFMPTPLHSTPEGVVVIEPVPVAIKKVKKTKCVDADTGQETGVSNDCVKGNGSCIDHDCAVGQNEV